MAHGSPSRVCVRLGPQVGSVSTSAVVVLAFLTCFNGSLKKRRARPCGLVTVIGLPYVRQTLATVVRAFRAKVLAHE